MISAIFLLLFMAPILIYISEFGLGVWSDHTKWAEMGSAFSGIYSPFIAFLAFLILIGQAKSQGAMNKHIFDQSYIKDVREDLNFYLEKLDKNLNESIYPEGTVRDILRQYSITHEEDLRTERCRVITQQFVQKNRKILDIWVAMYPLLIGLGVNKHHPYELSYTGSVLKISTVLSMESCIALDKVYYSSNVKIKKSDLIFWED